MQLIILYTLQKGVSSDDFENWVRTVDYPQMRGLSRINSFKTYRSQKLLMGEGAPSVHYVEIFDIPDMDGFLAQDMAGQTVQSVMGHFMGFAEAPEFIICEEVS